MFEYVIFGKESKNDMEDLLLSKVENKPITSYKEAQFYKQKLESDYNCYQCRIAKIDFTEPPNFINTIQ